MKYVTKGGFLRPRGSNVYREAWLPPPTLCILLSLSPRSLAAGSPFFFFFALLVSSASRLFLAHLSLSLSVVVGGGGRASILLLPPRSLPTQPPLDPARCTSGVVSSLPLFLYARRARRRQLAGEEGKAVLKRHKGCPHALKGNDASAWRWWFESW